MRRNANACFGIDLATHNAPALHIQRVDRRYWFKEVQQLLTEQGKHQPAGPVDLLIAATAERERLTVLCDDGAFSTVASVTGQPVRRVTDVHQN